MLSRCFSRVCDVHQGESLSLVLFVVYGDDIIERLNDSKLGCCIGDRYLGCRPITCADDLMLVSASVSILQKVIFICEKEASIVIRFDKKCQNISENIELVDVILLRKY